MTRDISGEVMVYNYSNIPALVDRVVAKHIDSIKEGMKEQNELILNTAINREGLLEKFSKLIAATISRKGYITFNRQMTTEEWFGASDIVARDLIKRLDEPGDTELLKNHEYHRSKNPQIKPEKVLLMIMNKRQLFRSLEQIQLIKILQ